MTNAESSSRFRFPRAHHLRRPVDFAAVYEEKNRAGDGVLLVFARPNELDHARIGLSVSRKHGGAVTRNRIKRLLREAYRLSQHELPAGLDMILIPRQNTDAGLDDYCASLIRLASKLQRRIEAHENNP